MTMLSPASEPVASSLPHSGKSPDDRLGMVERLMEALARGESTDHAGKMVLEQLRTGGKRLRARLALNACHAYAVPLSEGVRWAAAVELLHNATLVHDDIQDGDRTRRGHPTLWARFGMAQAINAGDLMLMLPFLALSGLGSATARLSVALARAASEVVRGQAEELSLLETGRLDRASYDETARAKTGALIALPVQGAALLAGMTGPRVAALGQVFAQVGLVFQLQDDVIDLFGEKGRENPGCDIYEGKVSALVVAQLERAPDTRAELLAILRTPREATTQAQVQRARALFEQSGAHLGVLNRICELESSVLEATVLREAPALRAVAATMLDHILHPVRHQLATILGEGP